MVNHGVAPTNCTVIYARAHATVWHNPINLGNWAYLLGSYEFCIDIHSKYSILHRTSIVTLKVFVGATVLQLNMLFFADEESVEYKDKKQHTAEKAKPLSSNHESASNWSEQRSVSPAQKTLGRQKRIIEPSLTPASTPISNNGTPQNTGEESSKMFHRSDIRNFDRSLNYASPETPLSKMDLMIPPATENAETLLSPRSIAQLEIPTPERLLPIGQHGKEGISALVDKVREALTIPDISHLKHDSLDKSDVSN